MWGQMRAVKCESRHRIPNCDGTSQVTKKADELTARSDELARREATVKARYAASQPSPAVACSPRMPRGTRMRPKGMHARAKHTRKQARPKTRIHAWTSE